MAHDGEAEAQPHVGPRPRALGLTKAFEHVGQQLGRDAAPGVGDLNARMGAVASEPRADAAGALGELHPVGQEIPHHLLESHAVAHHRRAGRIEHDLQRHATAGSRWPHGLGGRGDDGTQLHRLALHRQLTGRDP